jgi:hypothetical protein
MFIIRPLPQQLAEGFIPPERDVLILEVEHVVLLVQNEKILVGGAQKMQRHRFEPGRNTGKGEVFWMGGFLQFVVIAVFRRILQVEFLEAAGDAADLRTALFQNYPADDRQVNDSRPYRNACKDRII